MCNDMRKRLDLHEPIVFDLQITPQILTLDENGVDADWRPNDWVPNCEHFY